MWLGLILGLLIGLLFNTIVIWIVGRLNLGLTVDGFMGAFLAAVVIGIVSAVLIWLLGVFGLSIGGGWLGAIVYLIIAAVVLLVADRFLTGLKVAGFGGAIVAAIAIGVVTWLINWVLGLFV